MKTRYSLIRRSDRGGTLYCYDRKTNKRESLGTKEVVEARRIINAKNEAVHRAAMNLQLARVYLQHSDPDIATRTWRNIMDEQAKLKHGETADRFNRATKNKAFDSIRNLPAFSTTAEQLCACSKREASPRIFSYVAFTTLRSLHLFFHDPDRLVQPGHVTTQAFKLNRREPFASVLCGLAQRLEMPASHQPRFVSCETQRTCSTVFRRLMFPIVICIQHERAVQ